MASMAVNMACMSLAPRSAASPPMLAQFAGPFGQNVSAPPAALETSVSREFLTWYQRLV